MTKEKFKELYEKEMCELSHIESAIDKLGFQMDGRTDIHKNVLSAFQNYTNSHTFMEENGSDKLYYAYIADEVAENWEAFHKVSF